MATFSWAVNRFRVFLGMGEPPLEIVAYSSRRFVPFQLKQNTRFGDSRMENPPTRRSGDPGADRPSPSRGGREWSAVSVRRDVEDRSVLGVDRVSCPPDAATTPTHAPPDMGIRPGSASCSGGPGEFADGEVNAHLGNPG